MKRILLSAVILAMVAGFMLITLGTSSTNSGVGTYKIQLDNAFGLVQGADFKIAGVRAGSISKIDLEPGCIKGDPSQCHALVTVDVTQQGFPFHADAFCRSRPQSLIGEYFIECEPGSRGAVIKSGSTIGVNRTETTIPSDLLQNVLRMPYRERLTLIINELGAGVAGRSGDLAAALRRAVPALTETDNLLNLLANDSSTIQSLTANSNSVITELANNSSTVARFISEANRISTDTAKQSSNLQLTLQRLPGFLEQLRPAMVKLGQATDANVPVLQNLNTAAGQLNRLFTDLPPFSRSATPAIKALGNASVTGKAAVEAANPTISHLNAFAKPVPELAQNLAIVLHDLDDRSRAVEKDPRSPGGQGYTGLEALLQYAFNQPLAINTFGPFGHQLTIDAFVSAMCSPYATPGTIASNLKVFGAAYRSCYAWLGPNQPGVNETDPSNPTAAVPDPGGAPPGERGPATSAAKIGAASDKSRSARAKRRGHRSSSRTATPTGSAGSGSGSSSAATGTGPAGSGSAGSGSGSAGSGSAGSGSAGSAGSAGSGAASILQNTLGQIISALGGGGSAASAAPATSSGSSSQTQQLLNYLLAP